MPAPWAGLIDKQKLPDAFEEGDRDATSHMMDTNFQPVQDRDTDSISQASRGASSPRSSAYLTPAASTPTFRPDEEEEEEEETEEEGSITPTGGIARGKQPSPAYPGAFAAPLAPAPQSLAQALLAGKPQPLKHVEQAQPPKDKEESPSVIFVPPRSHRVLQLASDDSSGRESQSPSPTPKTQPSPLTHSPRQPEIHQQKPQQSPIQFQQPKQQVSPQPQQQQQQQQQQPPIAHQHHQQPVAAPPSVIPIHLKPKPAAQSKPSGTSEEEEEEDSDNAVPLPFYGVKRPDATPLYSGGDEASPAAVPQPHEEPQYTEPQQPAQQPQPMQQPQQPQPPSPTTFIRGPPQQPHHQQQQPPFEPPIQPYSQPSKIHPQQFSPVQFQPHQQQPQFRPRSQSPQQQPQFQPRSQSPHQQPQFQPQQPQHHYQFPPQMQQPPYQMPHFIQPPPQPMFTMPQMEPQTMPREPQYAPQQPVQQQPQPPQTPQRPHEPRQPHKHEPPKQPQQPLGFAGFTAPPRPKQQQQQQPPPPQTNDIGPPLHRTPQHPSGQVPQQQPHPVGPGSTPTQGKGHPDSPAPSGTPSYRTPQSFTPPAGQQPQQFRPVTPVQHPQGPSPGVPAYQRGPQGPQGPQGSQGHPQQPPVAYPTGPQYAPQSGPQSPQQPSLNSYPTTPQNEFPPEGGPMYLSSTDYSEPENEPDDRDRGWHGPTPHWSATLRKRPAPPGKKYPFGTSGNVVRAPPFIPCTDVPEGLAGMKLRPTAGAVPPPSAAHQTDYARAPFMDPGTPLAPMAQEYSPAAWKPTQPKAKKDARDTREIHEDGVIKVASKHAGGEKQIVLQSGDRGPKIGRWTLAQLKSTDGIIPSQYGTNVFASRKGMTDYSSPRDVHGIHYHRLNVEDPDMVGRDEDIALSDLIIPAQCGSNRFASRKGMTEYGAPRDTHGKHFHRLHLEDPNHPNFTEDVLKESDLCVPLLQQANRYWSRKGMTDYGAFRDVKGKHLHRMLDDEATLQTHNEAELRETDLIIPGQYGSNRFASRKGMTEYGAPRDVKGIHYHRLLEEDPSVQHMSDDVLRQGDGIIPGQYGSNKFASRKLMTEYGAFRDVRGPHMHHIITDDPQHFEQFDEETLRMVDGIIPGQYGTNRFASRKGMTEYGAPRDVKGIHMHRAFEDDPGSFANFNEGQLRSSDAIIPGQYGTNKYESQKGMTKFGTPRDVRGTHLHRLIDELDLDDFYDAETEQPEPVQQ